MMCLGESGKICAANGFKMGCEEMTSFELLAL
jgi:hypothetical protein